MKRSSPQTTPITVTDLHDADIDRLVELWNRDLPSELPASRRLIAWTLADHPGRKVALVELRLRRLTGYAIVSKLAESPIGVVDALVPARNGGRE